jgi:hypothetical protein
LIAIFGLLTIAAVVAAVTTHGRAGSPGGVDRSSRCLLTGATMQ